jgi:hypothetical protein
MSCTHCVSFFSQNMLVLRAQMKMKLKRVACTTRLHIARHAFPPSFSTRYCPD